MGNGARLLSNMNDRGRFRPCQSGSSDGTERRDQQPLANRMEAGGHATNGMNLSWQRNGLSSGGTAGSWRLLAVCMDRVAGSHSSKGLVVSCARGYRLSMQRAWMGCELTGHLERCIDSFKHQLQPLPTALQLSHGRQLSVLPALVTSPGLETGPFGTLLQVCSTRLQGHGVAPA